VLSAPLYRKIQQWQKNNLHTTRQKAEVITRQKKCWLALSEGGGFIVEGKKEKEEEKRVSLLTR
jgi:hypothetical protein